MNIGHRTRRRLLAELSAVAALWPAARMLQSDLAHAGTPPAPRRYLQLFVPHGMSRPHWLPRADRTGGLELDFTEAGNLSTMGPLQRFRDQLVVIDGLDMACGYAANRQGHEQGTAGVFTGTAAASNDGQLANGPSLDLLIYEHLIGQGVSMPAGMQGFGITAGSYSFHTQSNGTWQRASDPRESRNRFALFDGVATDDTPPDPAIARKKARRRAAIDYAKERVRRLQGDLGTVEREKLEQHLDALGSVRRRYEDAAPPAAGCSLPGEPSPYPTFYDAAQSELLADVQSTLIAQLFACDLTRVAAWSLGDTFGNVIPTWLGVDLAGHDILVHGSNVTVDGVLYPGPIWDEGGLTNNCPPGTTGFLLMQRWYHQLIADLFAKMDAIVDSNGKTVLENTTVLALSDFGNPAVHWNTGMPCFVTSGGAFTGNRFLSVGGINVPGPVAEMKPHNQVMVSIAQSFGLQTDTIGDPQFVGGLGGL